MRALLVSLGFAYFAALIAAPSALWYADRAGWMFAVMAVGWVSFAVLAGRVAPGHAGGTEDAPTFGCLYPILVAVAALPVYGAWWLLQRL